MSAPSKTRNDVRIFIEEFPNYEVSMDGKVYRVTDGSEVTGSPHINTGYREVCLRGTDDFGNFKERTCAIHRLVAQAFIENPNNYDKVDHITRDKTNNDMDNLRWLSDSENSANVGKRSGTSSIFKGVTWFKRDNKWKANITCNGKTYRLGNFEIEEDAAHAYDQKATELFGDIAFRNFLPDGTMNPALNNIVRRTEPEPEKIAPVDVQYKYADDYPGYKIYEDGTIQNDETGFIYKAIPLSGYNVVSIRILGVPSQPKVHRMVAAAFVPNPKKLDFVCHMDNDPYNNHASNLRWLSHLGVSGIRSKSKNNTSGYVGVCDNHQGRWTARIGYNGHKHAIGTYDTAIEAATAYDLVALFLRGVGLTNINFQESIPVFQGLEETYQLNGDDYFAKYRHFLV